MGWGNEVSLKSRAYFHFPSPKIHISVDFFKKKFICPWILFTKALIFSFHTEMAGHYRIQLPETNCHYIYLSTGQWTMSTTPTINHKGEGWSHLKLTNLTRLFQCFKQIKWKTIKKSCDVSNLPKWVLYWYPSSQNHSLWSQTFWWEHVFHPKVKSSMFSTKIHYLLEPSYNFSLSFSLFSIIFHYIFLYLSLSFPIVFFPYKFSITKHFPHIVSATIPKWV